MDSDTPPFVEQQSDVPTLATLPSGDLSGCELFSFLKKEDKQGFGLFSTAILVQGSQKRREKNKGDCF